MRCPFYYKILLYSLFLISVKIPLLAHDGTSSCCKPCSYNGFTIGAEWLYWRVKEEDLRAGSFVDDFPDPTLKTVTASIIQPDFTFNNGIRGHIGYQSPCTCWGLEAIYTYTPLNAQSVFREVTNQQTSTHRQFIIPNVNDFPSFEAFAPSSGLVAFTSLLTSWKGNLSYFDIELNRELVFNCCFNIRPHIGFRAAWMTQRLHMAGGLVFPSTNNSTFGSLKFKEGHHGYGIEGGLWSDWRLGCGFSCLGHLGGSILYSSFTTNILSESSIGENGPVVFIINSSTKNITANPTIECLMALKYETILRQYYVSAHVGWEQQVLFNMNQMAANSGYLSLQGLTVGANLCF